jgi:hypothetical protein
LGNCIGALIEVIFPILLLLLSIKIDCINFFSKKKYLKIELIAILSIMIGILLLYHSSLLFLFLITKVTFENMLYYIGFEWLVMVFLIISFIFVKNGISKKEEILIKMEEIVEDNIKLKEQLNQLNIFKGDNMSE